MNNIAFIGGNREEIVKNIETVLNNSELYKKYSVCIKTKDSDHKLDNVVYCNECDRLDIDKYDLFIFELESEMGNFDNIVKVIKQLLQKQDKKVIISVLDIEILDKLNINYKFFKSMDKQDTILAYTLS